MRLLKNEYIHTVINKVLIVILAFINTIIINRYLSIELKGEYTYLLNISNILNVVLNLGVAQSYPFFKKNGLRNLDDIFNSIFIVQIIIYTIPISIYLIANKDSGNLFWIIITTILMIYHLNISFVMMVNNIKLKNKVNILINVIYTILLFIIFIISSNKIEYILSAYIFKYILEIVLIIIVGEKIKLISLFKIDIIVIKKILSMGIYSMLLLLMTTLNYNIDIIILKYYSSYSVVGVYSVGVTLATMIWIIPDAFKEVLFSKTSKDDSIKEIIVSIKLNLYICCIIIVSFLFLGKIFIYIAYGKEYVNSFFITVILFIGTIPMIFYKIINTLYISIGEQKISCFILFISTVINIILNFIMIPIWGGIGAALSSVFSYAVCGVFFVYRFSKDYNVKLSEFIVLSANEVKYLKHRFLTKGEKNENKKFNR